MIKTRLYSYNMFCVNVSYHTIPYKYSHSYCSHIWLQMPPKIQLRMETKKYGSLQKTSVLFRVGLFKQSAARTGIEPVIPPWEGGVLTSWPTSHLYNTWLFYTIHIRNASHFYKLPAFLISLYSGYHRHKNAFQ